MDWHEPTRGGAAARVPRRLPGTSIEILRRPPQRPRAAVFDFDGTVSLVRAGWAELMIDLAVQHLAPLRPDAARPALRDEVSGFIFELAGKPSIFQMIRLAEEVARCGGAPLAAEEYLAQFQRRLSAVVEARCGAVRAGRTPAAALLVPGTTALLDALSARGVALHLVSGTALPDVLRESRLLGLDRWFGERIYAPGDDHRAFSKAAPIAEILVGGGLSGEQLVGLGDGAVETQCVAQVGGYAIGVASCEESARPEGDPGKRARLWACGADAIVPDFRDAEALVDLLFSPPAPPAGSN